MRTAGIQQFLNSATAGSVRTYNFYCRCWKEKALWWYVISVFVHDYKVINLF